MNRPPSSLLVACLLTLAASPAMAQTAPAAPPPLESGTGLAAGGLVLGASLESSTFSGAGVGDLLPTYFIGTRVGSLYVGGELGYQRVGLDVPVGAGTLNSHQSTLFIEPEVQWPFLHGAGGRLEGYLLGGLGIGHTWDNCANGDMCPTGAGAGLGSFPPHGSDQYLLQGGLGARYFFDPSFALGGIVGLRMVDSEGPNNISETAFFIFEGLTATAIF